VEETYATIYINNIVIRKAKDIGLNISKTCENALKEAIRRLEAPNPQNDKNSFSVNAVPKRVEWGCPY